MNVGTRLTCMMLTLAGIVLLGAGCAGKNTAITVISREDGSGTRSAFVELLGIAADGVDRTTELAEISNSTSVVLQSVADNGNAIGYTSLGSLSDVVKAVPVVSFIILKMAIAVVPPKSSNIIDTVVLVGMPSVLKMSMIITSAHTTDRNTHITSA